MGVYKKINYKIKEVKDMSSDDKAKLKAYFEKWDAAFDKKNSVLRSDHLSYIESHNSKCPNCSSTNVNNRIKRTKGEINGRSSMSGSSMFGFGHMSGSGSVKGEIDTLPVNKCDDCNHEWQIKKNSYSAADSYSDVADSVNSAFRAIDNAYNDTKWDPNDFDEVCKSLAEKRRLNLYGLFFKRLKLIFG